MPYLEIRDAKGSRSVKIRRSFTSIGSSKSNHICISDPKVSEQHAHIKKVSENYYLEIFDDRSLQVNGKEHGSAALSHGDEILLGNSRLRFLEKAPEEKKTSLYREAFLQLQDFSNRLSGDEDPVALLDLLLDVMIERSSANKGFVVLDTEGKTRISNARGINGEQLSKTLEELPDSMLEQVRKSREALMVFDAGKDSQFSAATSVQRLRVSSVLILPLIVQSELLGMIYLATETQLWKLTKEELEILSVFAAHTSLLLLNAMEKEDMRRNITKLRSKLEQEETEGVIASSEGMKRVFVLIEKVAQSDLSVLFTGETGTGKELAARHLHHLSPRNKEPFIAINCAAIPEALLESELFGYKKGAFTGADQDKAGKLAAAHGGMLFLDEIGDMPLSTQVKLLRVLQERRVTPLGGTSSFAVEFSLVCATHKNLEQEVAAGRFRQDLYYRVKEVLIELPPLRERGKDILLLAHYFLRRASNRYNGPSKLSPEAEAALLSHPWPGNIRELESTMKRACVLSAGEIIESRDLDLPSEASPSHNMEIVSEGEEQSPLKTLNDAVKDFQCRYIARALDICNDNRKEAAALLGVDPRTIFRYLKRLKGKET